MSTAKYKDPATGQWVAVPGITVTGGELIAHQAIPDYVKQEAMTLAEKVRSVQRASTVTFLAMADSHHCAGQDDTDWQENTNAGNLHGCMAAKILSYCLELDFVCHLGDLTLGNATTTTQLLRSQIGQLNSWLREAWKDIPQFRTVGDHDTGLYGSELVGAEYLYSAIGSHCTGAVYGSVDHGYCYRDFPEKKLRVICLNTSEGETLYGDDAAYVCSDAQLLWFARVLREVGSLEEWSILVLSHYPLDHLGTHPAAAVVKAYQEGGMVYFGDYFVDFSGHNSAKFVAQFHGHTHCFKSAKLHTINASTLEATEFDAWRVAVPNAGFYQNNHCSDPDKYGITFGEEETYDKVAGTGEDTAFTVNVVDPENQVLYSFCYGAGYDRVISYADITYHQVTTVLSRVSTSGCPVAVKDGSALRVWLEADAGYSLSSVRVVMDGVDITETAYADGLVQIEAVTGSVVITASAIWITNYVNQLPLALDTDGSIYNGCGYKAGYRLSSSGADEEMASMYTTGFIPCKYGDYIYLRNVTFQYGASSATNQRLSFYDAQMNHLGQTNANMAAGITLNGESAVVLDSKNIYTQLAVGDGSIDCTNAAFFRLNGTYIGEDSIITVNEPII